MHVPGNHQRPIGQRCQAAQGLCPIFCPDFIKPLASHRHERVMGRHKHGPLGLLGLLDCLLQCPQFTVAQVSSDHPLSLGIEHQYIPVAKPDMTLEVLAELVLR